MTLITVPRVLQIKIQNQDLTHGPTLCNSSETSEEPFKWDAADVLLSHQQISRKIWLEDTFHQIMKLESNLAEMYQETWKGTREGNHTLKGTIHRGLGTCQRKKVTKVSSKEWPWWT